MELFEKAVIETMKNLKDKFPNDEERKKIIVQMKKDIEEQGYKTDKLFNLIDSNS